MKTYRVSGHAFIPVEIVVVVTAPDPPTALLAGTIQFDKLRSKLIVPNSEDEGAVFDFRPLEATEVPPK